jgi:uncharacterized protein HemY
MPSIDQISAQVSAMRVIASIEAAHVARMIGSQRDADRQMQNAAESLEKLCLAMGYDLPVKRQQEAA